MKIKIDGLKQAIEMLQGLDLAAQQTLIAEIARKDPEMAIKLKQNLITFDDLQYLTVSMMKRLLQDIDIDVLGLALRGANKETVDQPALKSLKTLVVERKKMNSSIEKNNKD